MTVKKDGKVTATGRVVVSVDGKSRTVTTSGTDTQGKKTKTWWCTIGSDWKITLPRTINLPGTGRFLLVVQNYLRRGFPQFESAKDGLAAASRALTFCTTAASVSTCFCRREIVAPCSCTVVCDLRNSIANRFVVLVAICLDQQVRFFEARVAERI